MLFSVLSCTVWKRWYGNAQEDAMEVTLMLANSGHFQAGNSLSGDSLPGNFLPSNSGNSQPGSFAR